MRRLTFVLQLSILGEAGGDKALAGKLDRIGKQVKGVAAGQILFITSVNRLTYSAGLQLHQAICSDAFVCSIKHQEIVKKWNQGLVYAFRHLILSFFSFLLHNFLERFHK